MINTPEIDSYLDSLANEESALLHKISRETYMEVLMPNMLSGKVQGRFLSMISKMIQPTNVLEIGTFTGYSALCLAEGIKSGGVLCSLDVNEELHERVRGYLKEYTGDIDIQLHTGPALEIIPTLKYTFDLVFIDADKQNYANYYNMVVPMLSSGKYILVDNTLWKGKVTDNALVEKDKDTKALDAFNRMVAADSRVEQVIVPLRDGLTLIRKK
ncbi:MAG: O-methyltransferase [Cytophagaceae bacterium]